MTDDDALYRAMLACVRAAERDGYAELKLTVATEAEVRSVTALLRGFACRVRFAFRATSEAIQRLKLREQSDGWPVEPVTIDPPPTTLVLVVQLREGLAHRPTSSSDSSAAISSFGRYGLLSNGQPAVS